MDGGLGWSFWHVQGPEAYRYIIEKNSSKITKMLMNGMTINTRLSLKLDALQQLKDDCGW